MNHKIEVSLPKRINYSSRLPKDDESYRDCVIQWCTSQKGYFTMRELDERDELIMSAINESEESAKVIKISCTYLHDKITGEVIMTKTISCCELWHILAHDKRAIKAGMIVHGRIISSVEYCRAEDNECIFLFEAVYE